MNSSSKRTQVHNRALLKKIFRFSELEYLSYLSLIEQLIVFRSSATVPPSIEAKISDGFRRLRFSPRLIRHLFEKSQGVLEKLNTASHTIYNARALGKFLGVMDDRRQDPRRRVSLSAAIKASKDSWTAGEVIDISRGGACLKAQVGHLLPDKIRLRIDAAKRGTLESHVVEQSGDRIRLRFTKRLSSKLVAELAPVQ